MSNNIGVELFFDEGLHKYTDSRGNTYTSTTTLIDKYYEKFDTKKMARICELAGRKGDIKYRGKTAKMLEKEWASKSKSACEYGNEKHGYLEDCVKSSTGYRNNAKELAGNGRMLTVSDVIKNPGFGELNIEYFIKTRINVLYPSIFKIIVSLVKQGYRIYAEIGVFKYDRLVSGTIDLLFIKDKQFVILDWKTNEADIRFESGYFVKDNGGNITTQFKETHKTFYPPLSHLPASTGHKYTLQLSMYAYLCEVLGLSCVAIVLCHIRREMIMDIESQTLVEKVDFHNIQYLKDDIHALVEHQYKNRNLKKQIEITL